MEEDPRARLKRWLASGEARLQTLTFPQREIWETSPVPPGAAANNVCSFFEVKGQITFEGVRDAVGKVVERQEAMRTSFVPGKERPLQLIRSTGETVITYRELSEEEATPEGLERVMLKGFRKPFDIVRGPLYRLEMLRLGDGDHVLAFTIHHAVADGWTLGAFVQDLCTGYVMGLREGGVDLGETSGIRQSLTKLQMSYPEWGASERKRWTEKELAEKAEFWKKRLNGSRALFDAGREAGEVLEPLRKTVSAVPEELAEAAKRLAKKTGATLFSVLLAAFQISLNRWKGAEDIVVGTPVANRNRAAVGETMGYFSGIVPLRGQVEPDRPFDAAVGTVHEETIDAFAHAMPFAELAAALGEPKPGARHSVFDVRFALQNHPVPDIVLPGISTKLRTYSTGTARFDLGCELTEDDGGFELVWLTRPLVVAEEELAELERQFQGVLAAVCDQANVRPSAISV